MSSRPSYITLDVDLDGDADILYRFCDIVAPGWKGGRVPQKWKGAIVEALHKKQDRMKCGNCRGINLVSRADKDLLKIIARRLSNYVKP